MSRNDIPSGKQGASQPFSSRAARRVPVARPQDGIRHGPQPADVEHPKQVDMAAGLSDESILGRQSIAKQPASNQDKYGGDREAIRNIIGGWGTGSKGT